MKSTLKHEIYRKEHSLYCPECGCNPCRFLPDEARTLEGYEYFMSQLGQKRERSRKEVEAVFIHALLLGLDSTELEKEQEWEDSCSCADKGISG
jgi:hypothetical protein